MQYVHYLHCQHNHYSPACLSFWSSHAQLQFFAAIDHVLKHMIDSVLVNARYVSDYLSHFTPDAAEETGGAWFLTMPGIVGKDSTEVTIVHRRVLKIVALTFAAIVFTQSHSERRDRIDLRACSVPGFGAGQSRHQLIYVFELM
jgi:hypothetical protein